MYDLVSYLERGLLRNDRWGATFCFRKLVCDRFVGSGHCIDKFGRFTSQSSYMIFGIGHQSFYAPKLLNILQLVSDPLLVTNFIVYINCFHFFHLFLFRLN